MADATPEIDGRARGRAPTHVPTARCDSGGAWIADYDTSRNDDALALGERGAGTEACPYGLPLRVPHLVWQPLYDSGGPRTAQLHTTLAPSDAEAPVAA